MAIQRVSWAIRCRTAALPTHPAVDESVLTALGQATFLRRFYDLPSQSRLLTLPC